jgi:hypothetical protein
MLIDNVNLRYGTLQIIIEDNFHSYNVLFSFQTVTLEWASDWNSNELYHYG